MRFLALLLFVPTLFSTAVTQAASSGFIQDLPALSADKERSGAKIWLKQGANLGAYSKVAISQIEIFLDPGSPYKGITPDDLKAIADSLRQTITDQLEPQYPVVGKPGPGVLHVRIAVTNVLVKKKKRGLLSFTPIGFTLTTLQDVAGKRISLKNAVFEAELLDAASGERLGVLMDRLGKSGGKKEFSWDAVAAAAQFYAKRFRARLDAAHQ